MVDSVEITIDGEAVGTELATVEVARWGDDASHVLRAEVRWADGEGAVTEVSFSAAVLVTWAGEIEPLYQERCAACHSGDTESVLDSAESWAAEIDAILGMVSSGAMPIGGPALTEAEVAAITAWRDGGFP